MTTPEIGLFEAMYTARSLRHFKADPVPQELITKVIDGAIRASSGANAQHWSFVVVRDPALKRQLAEFYRRASDYAGAVYMTRPKPDHLTDEQYRQFLSNSGYLWEHLADAPVILMACLTKRAPLEKSTLPEVIQARYDAYVADALRISGSSIYPAIQNIILACRGLGLGTVITTIHTLFEDEVKALLGIPENVATFAMMPIGYPTRKYGPLTRKPVTEVAFADRWGNAWPG